MYAIPAEASIYITKIFKAPWLKISSPPGVYEKGWRSQPALGAPLLVSSTLFAHTFGSSFIQTNGAVVSAAGFYSFCPKLDTAFIPSEFSYR